MLTRSTVTLTGSLFPCVSANVSLRLFFSSCVSVSLHLRPCLHWVSVSYSFPSAPHRAATLPSSTTCLRVMCHCRTPSVETIGVSLADTAAAVIQRMLDRMESTMDPNTYVLWELSSQGVCPIAGPSVQTHSGASKCNSPSSL